MPKALALSLLVGLGGFAGTLARYGLSLASQRLSIAWPLGTFAANVLGCLAMGILAGLSARGGTLTPELRLALAVGFCGGFTTMSSLVLETSEMLRAGSNLHAVLYAGGTFAASMAAFVAGMMALGMMAKLVARV